MKLKFINMCAVGVLVAASTLVSVGVADAKDTIRVRLAEYSTKTGPFFIKLAEEYNSMQNDVTVKVEHLPWPEMQQQLITDISAGTAPDISHMATRWMAGFAKDGALAPIEGIMSDSFTNSFVPTFLDLQKQDGHTWGLPIAASARGLFINKDLFAQAGIANAPTTWDEAYAAAKKISALGEGIYGIGMQGHDLDTEGYWFYSLWTHGGDILGADGQSGFASKEAIAATENYIRFIKGGVTQPGVTASSREDLQNLFAAGKMGMVLSGPWLNKQLSDESPDLAYSISKIPMESADATYGVTDTISVLETSNNKEAAIKFLEFAFNDANRLEFGKIEGFVPVLKSMSKEAFFTGDPNMAVFLEMSPVAHFAPLVPHWEEMADALKSGLSQAYSGDVSSKVALEKAAAKMNELLAE